MTLFFLIYIKHWIVFPISVWCWSLGIEFELSSVSCGFPHTATVSYLHLSKSVLLGSITYCTTVHTTVAVFQHLCVLWILFC